LFDHDANAGLRQIGTAAGNDLSVLDQTCDGVRRQDRNIEILFAVFDQIQMLSDGLISQSDPVAGFFFIFRGERIEHLFEGAAADDSKFCALGKL
jgi:hypothetical protein